MQDLPFFHRFKNKISNIDLPKQFTYPFYYEPHLLSKIACNELQEYLENQSDFKHNFGLNKHAEGLVIGKMFGVLVCQDNLGNLGYLCAFSGKLAEQNNHLHFVPAVYDMLSENSFYKIEEEKINKLNQEIDTFINDEEYILAKDGLKSILLQAENDLNNQKQHIKEQKKKREKLRAQAFITLSSSEFEDYTNILNEQSKEEAILLKKMTKYWNYKKNSALEIVEQYEFKLNSIKENRKQLSSHTQQRLFAEYAFLNNNGVTKSIGEIFNNNPPAGAGECCAPKLLHYAFAHKLKPLALAEFWWGQSPKSEIRKHKHYYPACQGKCYPILMGHMLQGMDIEPNPLETNCAINKELKIIYEDENMLAVYKPSELLSVPGKLITDSVYTRIKQLYPNATGPLIVHRLDMSTSGIMLLAKNQETYTFLQKQFISRKIKKCYEALLDGVLHQNEGEIDFPIRVDLDDRPRQIHCIEYGKQAKTYWKKVGFENSKTRVLFYPITGRTHQLRVHASHPLGLNMPIVGDDLYGIKNTRLCLHAKSISFEHPTLKKWTTIEISSDF